MGRAAAAPILPLAIVLAGALALSARAAGAAGCNRYEPTSVGARWVYETRQSGKRTLRRTLSVVADKGTDGGTEVQMQQLVERIDSVAAKPAGSAKTRYRCDGKGSTMVTTGSADDGAGGRSSIEATSPGLPPEDKLQPGYKWRAEGAIDAVEGGTKARITIIRGSAVEAVESITVPAGRFDQALRVNAIESATARSGSIERQSRQQIVEWYVAGVGLVKRDTRSSVSASKPDAIVEELVSYSGLPAQSPK